MSNSHAVVQEQDDFTSSFGVYDGHGGDEVSSFCIGASDTKLHNHQDREDNVPASMQTASFRMDELCELSFNCKPHLFQSAAFTLSKRNTYGAMLVLFAFLSCIQCALSKTIEGHYCDTFSPQIVAFCPTFTPTGDCCPVINTLMDMEPSSPCLCPVLNSTSMKGYGRTLDDLLNLYYDCNGHKHEYSFSKVCEGMKKNSSSAPSTSPVKRTPLHLPDGDPTRSAEQWPPQTIFAIVLLSLLVTSLLVWLACELCCKFNMMLQDIEFGDPPQEEAPQQDQEEQEDYPLLQNPQQGQEEQSASSATRSIFAGSSSSVNCPQEDAQWQQNPQQGLEEQSASLAIRSTSARPSSVDLPQADAQLQQNPQQGLEEQSASSAVRSTSARPSSVDLPQADAQFQQNPQQGLEEQSASSAVRSTSARPSSVDLPQADAQLQQNPQQGLEEQSASSATRSNYAPMSQLAKAALAVQPQMPSHSLTGLKIMPSFSNKRNWKKAFDLPSPALTSDCSDDRPTVRKLISSDAASSSAAAIQKNRQLVLYDADFACSQIAAFGPGSTNEEAADGFNCPMEIEENAASQEQTTGEIFSSAVGVDAVPSASTPERTRRCTRSNKPDGYVHERMEDSHCQRKAAPKKKETAEEYSRRRRKAAPKKKETAEEEYSRRRRKAAPKKK